jgi:hypothetical protein
MILISICILDLLSTFVGMRIGEIEEKNIYYAFFIDKAGISGFVKAKIFMNFVCISIMEISLNEKLVNRINSKIWEKLTERARKKAGIYYVIAIISYCFCYIVAFFAVNFY